MSALCPRVPAINRVWRGADLRADADKEIERTLREQNQALEKRLRAT